jgi:hypothetical protein
MHVEKVLHTLLLDVIHYKRLTSLLLMVNTVLNSKRLSLTQLGRSLALPIQERSGIRRADRLLGNKKLHRERPEIYRRLCRSLIGAKQRPWVIVDWSHIPNTKLHVLRAALVTKGRALTLYEEVHGEKKQENAQVQRAFLNTFQALLPDGCRPIIVTDAGFHNPWFKQVLKLGWDYVGRIRGRKQYRLVGTDVWQGCKTLWTQSRCRVKALGAVELCRTASLQTYFYLIKDKPKGRHSRRNDGMTKEYRKGAAEPWLLASSLGHRQAAKLVIRIYRTRMQIEEGFRDLKSARYGFSFAYAKSQQPERVQILLLIAALASFLAWFSGWVAEQQQLHLQFQANSIKHRRVLSLFYLGCQVIRRNIKLTLDMGLLNLATNQCSPDDGYVYE